MSTDELVLSTVLEKKLQLSRTIANLLIYSSIILGVALLVQLYPVVPTWLFYSVLTGWAAYLVTGIAIHERVHSAYYASIILAILTLVVSLPQPEHYSFGLSLATITFLAGSILQVGVISSVVSHVVLKRRVH